jgi:uncharacterized protein with von Willebrand factor type A (vWA) domain
MIPLASDDGQPAEDGGHFLHNLLLFGRLLRTLGIDVNPSRMITLVRALEHIEIGHKSDFYYATRCLLVHEKDDLPVFDIAFDLFWRRYHRQSLPLNKARLIRSEPSEEPQLTPRPAEPRGPQPENNQEQTLEDSPLLEVNQTYSQRELLRRKDFSEMTTGELDQVKQLISDLLWRLGERRTRRYRPGQGQAMDMRRALRRSLRSGGEIMVWPRRKPRYRPRPLVILADVSGSMERYTRLLLYFIYSLSEGLDRSLEAFVFSTRLTRITYQVQGRDLGKAMQEVSLAVKDWSGGTRIGAALKNFNYNWARRVLGRGAVVLLISDGWDRGDPQLLAREISRLQRSCHRLIWLNPLLGLPDYEPLTRGMQAALPYIDDFLPVHNLISLEQLAFHLSGLKQRRPARRQSLIGQAATVRQ